VRMEWARKFIGAWLEDPKLQFISGQSLDSLADLANAWIRKSIGFGKRCPIVSSEDVRSAALEVIDSEENINRRQKEIDRLDGLIQR
jgi:hypothetical protein